MRSCNSLKLGSGCLKEALGQHPKDPQGPKNENRHPSRDHKRRYFFAVSRGILGVLKQRQIPPSPQETKRATPPPRFLKLLEG